MSSNEMIPFGSQNNLPSLAGIFDGLSNLGKSGFVEKWPTLSVKGGKFHGVVQGESTTFVDADGVPVSSLECIIVGAPAHRARVYYAGKFDPANPAAPDCSSINGRTADADIQAPQSKACQTCERSIKVKQPDGKERAACQQIKYLAVIVRGQEEHVYRLRLPMTSLYDAKTEGQNFMAFDQYCDFLRKNNTPHTGCVVSKLIFDAEAEYPKLLFKAVAHLPEQMLKDKILPVIKSELVKEICEGTAEQIGDGSQPVRAIANQAEQAKIEAPKDDLDLVAQEVKVREDAKAAMEARFRAELEAKQKAELEAKIKAELVAKEAAELAKAKPTPEQLAAEASAKMEAEIRAKVMAEMAAKTEKAEVKAEKPAKAKKPVVTLEPNAELDAALDW